MIVYVGVGASMPVISEPSASTGAHVQKRLVSPYAVFALVIEPIFLEESIKTYRHPTS